MKASFDMEKFNALIDRDLEHYAGKLAKRALRAATVGNASPGAK